MARRRAMGLFSIRYHSELPMCAVCGRRVDDISRYDNPMKLSIRFIVRCHGEEETVDLAVEELEGLRGLTAGVAFQNSPKRLK